MHLLQVSLNSDRYPDIDTYPFNLPIFKESVALTMKNPITLFVGENGSGKSTLLEAIARVCGIYIWGEGNIVKVTYNPYEKRLFSALDIEWSDGRVSGAFFGSQIFRNFAQLVEEWARSDPGILEFYGGSSLLTKSHGQSTMAFFRACFGVKGLFLLDEPETGLSPKSQLALKGLIEQQCAKGHAQFVIATHSPILMSINNAQLYSFDSPKIEKISFHETTHYSIYKNCFKH